MIWALAVSLTTLAIVAVLSETTFRRGEHAKVVSGFYKGYSGRILDRRCFLWYRIDIGTRQPWFIRWDVDVHRSKIGEKIRVLWIEKDK